MSSNNFSNQGILFSSSGNLIGPEQIALENPFDTQIYTEPDGSKWIRIVHHNNPKSKSFGSTLSNFEKPYYIDEDRWFNVSLCDKIINNVFEFMVSGMLESTSWLITKYRWIQGVNPMRATYNDVSADKIFKNEVNYVTNNLNGLYARKDLTYLCANNGTYGNWWGAIGNWEQHQNGCPGWDGVVTTGYQDLFLRIDNITTSIVPYENFALSKQGKIFTNNLYEI